MRSNASHHGSHAHRGRLCLGLKPQGSRFLRMQKCAVSLVAASAGDWDGRWELWGGTSRDTSHHAWVGPPVTR